MKEEETFIFKMNDASIKGALGEPLDFVMRMANGTSFNILNTPISTTPVVMFFPKNSYLTQIFSEWIQNMLASGLIEYWIKNQTKLETPQNFVEREPKALTLQNLQAPFLLCTLGLLIATCTFIIEIILLAVKTLPNC